MSDRTTSSPAMARPSGPLRGQARVPGDRAISHRALILGGLASGESRICGLAEVDDVMRTAAAMRAFGARVERSGGDWIVSGVGNGCLLEPEHPLDFGATAAGLLLSMGLAGTYDMRTSFTGDASLSRMPLGRVLDPLRLMGVQVRSAPGDRIPLALHGPRAAAPISYRIPLASAQVKSSVLLAGLNAPGVTTVIESRPTADHTERLLRAFGAGLEVEVDPGGLRQVRIEGQGRLAGQLLPVPSDPVAAGFLIVSALVVAGSEVTLENVLLNPTRSGLVDMLVAMGASIDMVNRRVSGGEDVADLRVRSSELKGVTVPAARVPALADDYAALAVAAAFAEGDTWIEGVEEVRAEAPERLAAVVAGLKANGIGCEETRDGLLVRGAAGAVAGGAAVATGNDHRVALAFLAMGMAAERSVEVDDTRSLAAKLPGLLDLTRQLGGLVDDRQAVRMKEGISE